MLISRSAMRRDRVPVAPAGSAVSTMSADVAATAPAAAAPAAMSPAAVSPAAVRRAVALGLAGGAVVGFLAALLRPRRPAPDAGLYRAPIPHPVQAPRPVDLPVDLRGMTSVQEGRTAPRARS